MFVVYGYAPSSSRWRRQMKVTSDDTRMLEIEFGQFVHVRGEAVEAVIDTRLGLNLCGLTECGIVQLEALRGKRVLILELVEPCQ